MEVTVKKITDKQLMLEACESTFKGKSNQSLLSMYKAEHSPSRTQLFWITCDNIPLFVSTHLLRHNVGSQPYALTHRSDRIGGEDKGRETPTKLSLLINAQSLIDMAKVRMCKQASKETRDVFMRIVSEMHDVDNELWKMLVPKCVYRNGICGEPKPCGYMATEDFNYVLGLYKIEFNDKQFKRL